MDQLGQPALVAQQDNQAREVKLDHLGQMVKGETLDQVVQQDQVDPLEREEVKVNQDNQVIQEIEA